MDNKDLSTPVQIQDHSEKHFQVTDRLEQVSTDSGHGKDGIVESGVIERRQDWTPEEERKIV